VNAKAEYERWLRHEELDRDLRRELLLMEGNEREIEDRFYRSLTFGTGGLRGVLGAGTNRMNRYTVRKVTQALARCLARQGETAMSRGVVIAYDSRRQSPEFAREAALVLAANRVKAYLFEGLRPTPVLSFAVRHLGAAAGIMITASHNPPEYNGYKLYGADGAQITAGLAEAISMEMADVDELAIPLADAEEAVSQGLLEEVGAAVDEAYAARLRTLAFQSRENNADYRVVYTPLHGTGSVPVRTVLHGIGFRHVYVVPQQEWPDADFPTVASPNPEDPAVFALAIEWAEKAGADLVMATDPDADRVGVAVRDGSGGFVCLTGNQLGALLLAYILSQRVKRNELPGNGVIVKTIVTSEMGAAIAARYGVETVETLTGFKHIAEVIKRFEDSREKTFLFGYEESCGYLIGDFCRDKDAVQACMLTAEMAAYYDKQGRSLHQVLLELYEQVGFYQEDLVSFTWKGREGTERIHRLMEHLRKQPPERVGDVPVAVRKDYLPGIEGLPPADVIKFLLADGSWFAARPSGTEPKIKFYFGVKGTGLADASERLKRLKTEVLQFISRKTEGSDDRNAL
jgi:phosphoglucomutase